MARQGANQSVHSHQYHHGDTSQELHNHPYGWSVSLILWRWYSEERRVGVTNRVIRRIMCAGMINFIGANTFHRVDTHGAWTLFLTGRKTQQWGFWDRHTLQYWNHSGK